MAKPNWTDSGPPITAGGHRTPAGDRDEPVGRWEVLPRVVRNRFLRGRQVGERQGHGPGG